MNYVVDIFTLIIIIFSWLINIKEVGLEFPIIGFLALLIDYLSSIKLKPLRDMVPRWFLNGLAIAVIGVTFWRINWDNALNVLMEGFILLITVKWIERSRARDYLQIALLCLLLVVGHAFFTFSMDYLFGLFLLFITETIVIMLLAGFSQSEGQETSLVDLPSRENTSILKWLSGLSLAFLFVSLPVTTGLFLILPRTETPLLLFLQRGTVSPIGFTDLVTLGDVKKIQETNEIAFRAILERTDLPLYWRGIVFDSFDGKNWSSSSKSSKDFYNKELFKSQEKLVKQKIILEPYGNKYLFCLDMPERIEGNFKVIHNLEHNIFLAESPIFKRIEYYCYSTPIRAFPKEEVSSIYTSLPDNISPKVKSLVKELIGSSTSKEEIAWKLSRWLKSSGDFSYSFSGLPIGEDPLEEFLLKHKKGNCEYFASALGVMLRIAGIPSRLVGGYYGGYKHPLLDYIIVPQKNAHLWVEAFITSKSGEKGWVRLDPTPLPPELSRGYFKVSLLFKLRLYLDFINYYWHRSVIQYTAETQVATLNKAKKHIEELKKKDLLETVKAKIKNIFLACLVFVTLMVVFKYFYDILTTKEQARVFKKFEKTMEELGFKREPWEGLEEFSGRIEKFLREPQRSYVKAFIELYSRCLYREGKFEKSEIKSLLELVRKIKNHENPKD